MEQSVSYSKQYLYDTLKIGITVPVRLFLNDAIAVFEAKLDTGSANCIFERIHGENLGLEIESGEKQTFSTAVGTFVAYAHEVNLVVLEIEVFTRVYFAEDENYNRNVLGRQGFLDQVKLGLIDYEGKLLLSDYR